MKAPFIIEHSAVTSHCLGTDMPTIQILPAVAHLWFLLLVLAVLEGVAVYTWHYRREPGALSVVQIEICKGTWLLALCLAGLSAESSLALFWVNIARIAAMLTTLVWLRWVAQLSEADCRLPAWFWKTTKGVVGVFCALVLTNNWHEWFWRVVRNPGNSAQIINGPGCLIYALAVYSLFLFGTGLCVRWALQSVGLRRRQALLILIAGQLPWAGHLMASKSLFTQLDPLPACFSISSIILAWTYFRWSVIKVIPLAQQAVVKSMIDGLMVVDEAGYIIEMNSPARSLWGNTPVVKGYRFEEAVQVWPEITPLSGEGGVSTLEASRTVSGVVRHFQITLTPLRAPAGSLLGRVLVFRDITLEKQRQARIVEQEKALTLLAERERLGREVHDGPSQLWSFLAMQVHAVRILIGKQRYEQAVRMLDQLQNTVQKVHIELRESISGLQADVSGGGGLLAALENQLEWYRKNCNLQANLIQRCPWPADVLSPWAEAQTLRILQEALSNVRKSAHACMVQIRIERENHHLTFLVEDDGCGFDPSQMTKHTGHHGLNIMCQRAEEIGGEIQIDSAPGAGTRVILRVPLADNHAEKLLAGCAAERKGDS